MGLGELCLDRFTESAFISVCYDIVVHLKSVI